MKILLIYPNVTNQRFIQLGIAYLSSALKQKKHEVELFDTTFGYNKQELKNRVEEFGPGLIGFSARSTDFEFAVDIAKEIKKNFGIPIVFGGSHATIVPDEVIARAPIDMVCVGEAEEAFVELASKMSSGKKFKDTKNFWFKEGNKVVKNPVRRLTENLDSLPFPDRKLFDKRHLESESGMIFITGRGCPFKCSYCINHKLHEIYKDCSPFVRFRSVENVIQEIKKVRKELDFNSIYFGDETFTIGKERIKKLCTALKEQVNLPFSIMTRAETLDREILTYLKMANCSSIAIGIETGNEKMRFDVLNRKLKNETIIKAFKLAKEFGIYTYSFNMLGLPFETKETIMETIELNRLTQPSSLQATIFAPFKGTKLRELCVQKNWLREEPKSDYYTESFLEMDSISRVEIEAFQKMFWMYCYAPKPLYPLLNAVRFSLQLAPDVLRHKVGLAFVRLGQVFGLVKRLGFRQTAKQIYKKYRGA